MTTVLSSASSKNVSNVTKVIGIDSGAKKCGFACLGLSHETILIWADAIGQETDPGEKYGEARRRLVQDWTNFLADLFDEWTPQMVVCETVPITGAANASGQRLKALMVVVVAQVLCVQRGILFLEVAANTVKLKVTGKGDSTKPKIREAVIEIFPELADRRKEMTATPDISDAIAVALTGVGYDCRL